MLSFKIGSKRPKKLGPIFSLLLMRKPPSRGQKWFLRPYSLLIRGIFHLRSGLNFHFGYRKSPNREWGKCHISKRKLLRGPQKPLLTPGKWFSHEEKWEKGPLLLLCFAPGFMNYIFGIVLQYPTIWLKQNFWCFFSTRRVFRTHVYCVVIQV